MTRTKSRRRFPSDGCPGPVGDPLVCIPFLDDGMIRVQLNRGSSQRIESAAQDHGGGASSPPPLRGRVGVGGPRVAARGKAALGRSTSGKPGHRDGWRNDTDPATLAIQARLATLAL